MRSFLARSGTNDDATTTQDWLAVPLKGGHARVASGETAGVPVQAGFSLTQCNNLLLL